ncbi:hypothetical protein Tco_1009697 [Tanacetum coccineum]
MAIRGILAEDVWIESPYLVKEFPNKLSFEQQTDLEIIITRDEIKKAVWDCGVDKSPGPGGFSFGFFRRYWYLLENDVVEAVLYFFNYEKFSKGGNFSFIALIPKTSDALLGILRIDVQSLRGKIDKFKMTINLN